MADLDSPIFFIGVPRSGTTITFEQFAAHEDLAWLSNYARAFPRFAPVNLLRRLVDNKLVQIKGKKNQFNEEPWINRYLPRPDESYEFWNAHACEGFDRAFLLDTDATPAEAARLRKAVTAIGRYQGRPRVTAKLTGPGRIRYLNSVWPKMRVVHVIRDGVAVTRSLLNVQFWEKGGGFTTPWWTGGVTDEEFARWQQAGAEPGALAALQWRRIIETTRSEAAEFLGDRYIEVKYEEFMSAPRQSLRDLYERLDFSVADDCGAGLEVRNKRYGGDWELDYLQELGRWMAPVYDDLGYDVSLHAKTSAS